MQINLVWWYINISWIVLWKDWIALLWSRPRSQERFKIPVNVHLDNISSTAELSVTKFGMAMHHHGPVSCKKISLLPSSSESQWGLIWSKMEALSRLCESLCMIATWLACIENLQRFEGIDWGQGLWIQNWEKGEQHRQVQRALQMRAMWLLWPSLWLKTYTAVCMK